MNKAKLLKRIFYRLVHWANTPVPEEQLRHMYRLGKEQGHKEALQKTPIVHAQPALLHLPPGEWARQWRETHGLRGPAIVDIEPITPEPIAIKDMTPEQIERVPTIQDLTADWMNEERAQDPFSLRKCADCESSCPFSGVEETEHMPAIVKAIHQHRMKAG